jgi:glycine/D-amino acid oxidase-like deaminating enzyme
VGGEKRLRHTWAFARTLPRDILQFSVRMLTGWMPEEGDALRGVVSPSPLIGLPVTENKKVKTGNIHSIPTNGSIFSLGWAICWADLASASPSWKPTGKSFLSPKNPPKTPQKPSENPPKTPNNSPGYTDPMPFDVVIAGAGIVGAACALEFGRSGLTVAIVEPAEIGGGATAAGMGHLAVMDDSPAQFALTSYSQTLWNQLSSDLPADVEYLPCGSLWVAADEMEMAEVHRKFTYYTARHIAVEILDEHALRQAEPNLRPGLAGALLLKDDAVIYPPCAARYFLAQAHLLGAEIVLGRRVIKAEKGTAQLDNGTSIAAGSIVLATGTAARTMLPGLELQPRKGHLLITDRYPGFVNHQLIELGYLKSAHSLQSDSVAFNVQPRKTGQLLIGSSRQYGTEDAAIDSHMLSNMLRRAVEYMPPLKAVSAIRAWTGFRAATPDKLPFIGACADLAGVYLATGHEGLGISTSLATAKLLADLLLNRESVIPREPYAPTRSFAHA